MAANIFTPCALVVLVAVAGCLAETPSADPDGPATSRVQGDEVSSADNTLGSKAGASQDDNRSPDVGDCSLTIRRYEAPIFGTGPNFGAGCPLEAAAQVDLGEYGSAFIEVWWTEMQPTVSSVELEIQASTCGEECSIGQANGSSSPVTLSLDDETLAAFPSDEYVAQIILHGLAHDQQVDVYVSLFYQVTVPRDYSARP